MKTLGILGGMSVESTLLYYQKINQLINKRLKEQENTNKTSVSHNAKLVIYSVDFAEIAELQYAGQWQRAGEYLAQKAQHLQQAGVDGILLATNTMHKVAPIITQNLHVPFLHLIDMTAQELQQKGVKKVGLLGTQFTMTDGFYQAKLLDYGIEVILPSENEQSQVHDIIYNELIFGEVLPKSKATYQSIIENLAKNGAETVILGCTEIGLLIEQADVQIPILDTTVLHINKAVEWILAD